MSALCRNASGRILRRRIDTLAVDASTRRENADQTDDAQRRERSSHPSGRNVQMLLQKFSALRTWQLLITLPHSRASVSIIVRQLDESGQKKFHVGLDFDLQSMRENSFNEIADRTEYVG